MARTFEEVVTDLQGTPADATERREVLTSELAEVMNRVPGEMAERPAAGEMAERPAAGEPGGVRPEGAAIPSPTRSA